MRKRPSPAAIASKISTRLVARGPVEVLAEGAGRIRSWFSSSGLLVFLVAPAEPDPERRDDEQLRPAPPAVARDDLILHQAAPSDARSYAREIGTDSPSTFTGRLSTDTWCFLVSDRATRTLMHASWVTTGSAWTRELDRYVVAPERAAYTYESFTRPEARGRGIYPYTLRSMKAWAADSDLRELWVAVEASNAPSLKAVAKAGFVEAFRVPVSKKLGRTTVGPPQGPRASEAAGILSRTRESSAL